MTINKKKLNNYKIYRLFFIAVIANQYTNPGAKPTMSGIHTGHPSAALVI
jgi:hypothetical protein